MRKERCCQEQEDHRGVGKISEHVVGLVVNKQQDRSHDQRTEHPHELLTGTVGEIEDARLVKGITRAVDVEPSEDSQREKHTDGQPIDILYTIPIS